MVWAVLALKPSLTLQYVVGTLQQASEEEWKAQGRPAIDSDDQPAIDIDIDIDMAP